MRDLGLRELGVEGVSDARWILQDFADIVVHVFHESQREFYDIEGLWADAKQVRWKTASKRGS
jgi:ribosome-associated protein